MYRFVWWTSVLWCSCHAAGPMMLFCPWHGVNCTPAKYYAISNFKFQLILFCDHFATNKEKRMKSGSFRLSQARKEWERDWCRQWVEEGCMLTTACLASLKLGQSWRGKSASLGCQCLLPHSSIGFFSLGSSFPSSLVRGSVRESLMIGAG